MNAYFDTLKYLMILMILIYVFSFPTLLIYKSYDSLKNEAMYMFTKYSLGNLGKSFKNKLKTKGGASTLCQTAPIDSTFLPLSCSTGEMNASMAKFGIIPESAPT